MYMQLVHTSLYKFMLTFSSTRNHFIFLFLNDSSHQIKTKEVTLLPCTEQKIQNKSLNKKCKKNLQKNCPPIEFLRYTLESPLASDTESVQSARLSWIWLCANVCLCVCAWCWCWCWCCRFELSKWVYHWKLTPEVAYIYDVYVFFLCCFVASLLHI